MKLLSNVKPSNESLRECSIIIKEVKDLFANFTGSKIITDELLDLVNELIKNQDSDGNWRLINSDDMPFDAKVEYWKYPTILFTSIMIQLYVIQPDKCANIKGFEDAFFKAVEAVEHGKLIGHGFDAFKFKVDALKTLFQADARRFIELYSNKNQPFVNMINLYKEEIKKYLLDGKTVFDYNEEFCLRMEELINLMNGENKIYLFVYGTLMSNNRRGHTYLKKAEFKGKSTLHGYSLYDLGYYPGITEDKEGKVKGEVYSIDIDMIPEIDKYEAEGTLYKRTMVKVFSEKNEPINAYTYVYIPSVEGNEKVEFKFQPWYEKASEDKRKYVWYACYGSNINKERFMKYIKGDITSRTEIKRKGCNDKSDPIDEKPYIIKHPLYFSNSSGTWGNRGVAFLDTSKEGLCYGKIYLITKEQFDCIQVQEGSSKCWYGKVVNLGFIDEIPIITFTQMPQYRKEVTPCAEYLDVIKNGILKTYSELSEDDVNYYLMKSYIKTEHLNILRYLRAQEHGVNILKLSKDMRIPINSIVSLISDLKESELIKQDCRSKRLGLEWNSPEAIYYSIASKREAIDRLTVVSSVDNYDEDSIDNYGKSDNNYNEFIILINKYNNAKVEDIKNNLYKLFKEKHLRVSVLEEMLNITSHTAKSYTNQSVKSKPSLENILKICISLNVKIDDLIVENNRQLRNQGVSKKWDADMKNIFIKDFEELGVERISEKYKLAEGTCVEYYRNFRKLS